MGRPAIDLTGKRFGKLTVIGRDGIGRAGQSARWRCMCDCGGETVSASYDLRTGATVSCGCARKEHKGNDWRLLDGVVHVMLSNAPVEMLCDKSDWERLSHCTWGLGKHGYAVTNTLDRKRPAFFHHLLMQCPDPLVRDHINRNKLDNRRVNLRLVTRRENIMNSDAFEKCGWGFLNGNTASSN